MLNTVIVILGILFTPLTLFGNSESPKDPKPTKVDEAKAPQTTATQIRFFIGDMIIPLVGRNGLTYVVFNLELGRTPSDKFKEQEDDIPVIIDLLISDLVPALEKFWDGKTEGLNESLNKRISNLLKQKYSWISTIKLSDVYVQSSIGVLNDAN